MSIKSPMRNKREKRPNIFIVGSMKCGTTILYDFLTSHPDIGGGDEKEAHYFSLHYEKGDAWYKAKYRNSGDKTHFVDASPTYFDMCLQVPTAERIKAFSPDAKIIILIRNPIQRAVSHFNHLKKINKHPLLESISFDDLVEHRWPAGSQSEAYESVRRMIFEFSRFGEKIRKFIDCFGYENVMVVHNDDLRDFGSAVVPQVLEFVGVHAVQDADFSQQRYKHGSEEITISQDNYFKLLNEFSEDYYFSCSIIDANRPFPPIGARPFNQPIGALLNDVGVGEDGWLFLVGGTNNVLEMFTEDLDSQVAHCEQWYALIEKRVQRLAAMGSQYYHVMLPEKMTVLGEKLRWPIDTRRSRGAAFDKNVPEGISNNIVSLIRYMLSLEQREKYFLKTDSHWNHLGAFVAYQLICSSLGFQWRKDLLARPKGEGEHVFDLGSKLPDRPKEKALFARYRLEATTVSDEGLVRYKRENKLENDGSLHVGSQVEFHNPGAPNKQRIMIFGDSFSEYRDHLLTGLFAETFEHTKFIWSASLDFRACEEFKPDVVFVLMTERFMARLPDDRFDLLEYSKKRLAALSS